MPKRPLAGRAIKGIDVRRSLMVAVGITLFVSGFVLTLSALSGMALPGVHGASRDSGEIMSTPQSDIWTVVGFAVSLTGLVLATVGPALSFIHAKRSKN